MNIEQHTCTSTCTITKTLKQLVWDSGGIFDCNMENLLFSQVRQMVVCSLAHAHTDIKWEYLEGKSLDEAPDA